MTDYGDRWLAAWSLGYAAVGAASVLVPLYAIELGAGAFVVSVVAANAALVFAVSAAAPVLALLVVSGHPDSDWDRRIGVLNTWQGYGWLAGLVAGAAWTAAATRITAPVTAQRWFFYASAVACALATLLAWYWLPGRPDVSYARFGRASTAIEGLQRGAGRGLRLAPFSGLRAFWALRRLHPRALAARLTPGLAGFLAASALFFTGFAAFFGPLPAYLASALELPTDRVFALFVVSSAASAAAYGRVGALAAERTPQAVLHGALAVRVVLFPAVAFVTLLGALAFPGFVALFVVLGLTWAAVAVAGTTIVARLAPPAVRGDALGAYAALGGLGTAVGSVLGGVLAAQTGYLVAFAAAGGFVLVGGGAALAARRSETAVDAAETA